MSSSPVLPEEEAYNNDITDELEAQQPAQIVPIWGDLDSEYDLVAITSNKHVADESSPQTESITQILGGSQDLATDERKELEGANILQRTSSTMEQDLIAKLKSLAEDTPIVSEAMEEAGWTKPSTKAERERIEKLIASSKAQDQKTQDLQKRLKDQQALESQTARAQQTASVLKSLFIFALGRKPETFTEDITNDLEEATAQAVPYQTNAGFKPRILQWRADLKIEITHNDATPLEFLRMLILAHDDPAKLTSDRLSAAIEQKVQEGDLNCYDTALILSLIKTTVVRMIQNLRHWEEDHVIFCLRVLQLLSYHYPEASFLETNELRGLLYDCKTKLKLRQVEHTCLVYGLEDLLDQSFGEQTNMAGETLAKHVYEIAVAKDTQVPGLTSADFFLIADGNDLLLLTKPIMKSTIRIFKDGTFHLESADDLASYLLCVPNLLEEGKTFKHTLKLSHENWYMTHLLKACERKFAETMRG
jgi:hypothetical protein